MTQRPTGAEEIILRPGFFAPPGQGGAGKRNDNFPQGDKKSAREKLTVPGWATPAPGGLSKTDFGLRKGPGDRRKQKLA